MAMEILSGLLLLPAMVAGVYSFIMCILGVFRRQKNDESIQKPTCKYAIVIPAHNEETMLHDALMTCAALKYPKNKIKTYVIADNCDDGTASIARYHKVNCLTREDPFSRGKGQALSWALPQVLADQPEAVIVLDADCKLESNALKIFDSYLAAGENVLQAKYISQNIDESMVSYLAGIGAVIENELFYAPKSQLGLSVLLRGTGMVFRRQVLERCPWKAGSLVEDAEYTIRLVEAGYRVRFVSNVCVTSAYPVKNEQLRVQRMRWIGGSTALARSQGMGLILKGIISNKWYLADLGLTLLIGVRSIVAVELLLAHSVSMITLACYPETITKILYIASIGLIGMQLIVFGIGVLWIGLSFRRIKMLLTVPKVIAGLMIIAIKATIIGRPSQWERTPR